MQPAPSKQWCTIDRLCRTSSLYAKGQHIHNKMLNTDLLLHIEDSHNLRRKLNCLVQASICNNNVPLLIRIVRCLYYQHITVSHHNTPLASDLLMFCSPWAYRCRRCSSGWSRRSNIQKIKAFSSALATCHWTCRFHRSPGRPQSYRSRGNQLMITKTMVLLNQRWGVNCLINSFMQIIDSHGA